MNFLKATTTLILGVSTCAVFAATPPQKIDTLTKMDVYLLPDSVARKGDEVSYFLIFDFKETDKIGKKSFKSTLTTYNGSCTGGQTVEKLNIFHVEKMAQGKVLMRDRDEPEYNLGLPDTLARKYTDIVCKIK
jgi:hypothetical protein